MALTDNLPNRPWSQWDEIKEAHRNRLPAMIDGMLDAELAEVIDLARNEKARISFASPASTATLVRKLARIEKLARAAQDAR